MIGLGRKGSPPELPDELARELEAAPASLADSVAAATSGSSLQEGILHDTTALPLHHGGRLDELRIAWRLTGKPGLPLVVALGGISGGRRVWTGAPATREARAQRGWWEEIVGPGRALDSERCRILGFDYLGGSGETTGPARGQDDFPSVSAYDQAEVLRRLLEHLALPAPQAIVGASYGGMVALAFAQRWPERARRIVVISAADRPHPMSTAWRSVQRAIVRFAVQQGEGPEGLRLARALAMATYRSADEFAERFGGLPERHEGRFRFPVESYLLARGDAYAQSFVPEAFVCLSESIDLHRVDPAQIRTPATLVAVREDQLVPLADMRALQARLAGPAELIEISSRYGHDAFLKEAEALRPLFTRVVRGAQS
ncbi:MAG: homoserine O-succinyltransferase [Proteobacteria bacterium]|nr:MAG: homoserine O-succinyltransferase [Pseudomonadota bacterium]